MNVRRFPIVLLACLAPAGCVLAPIEDLPTKGGGLGPSEGAAEDDDSSSGPPADAESTGGAASSGGAEAASGGALSSGGIQAEQAVGGGPA